MPPDCELELEYEGYADISDGESEARWDAIDGFGPFWESVDTWKTIHKSIIYPWLTHPNQPDTKSNAAETNWQWPEMLSERVGLLFKFKDATRAVSDTFGELTEELSPDSMKALILEFGDNPEFIKLHRRERRRTLKLCQSRTRDVNQSYRRLVLQTSGILQGQIKHITWSSRIWERLSEFESHNLRLERSKAELEELIARMEPLMNFEGISEEI
jgi:hypothetical protein